jgi:hypothetical protein
MTRLERRAHQLRNSDMAYKRIDKILGLPNGKAWIIINRERHNANARESSRRYQARGCVALCDVKDPAR